MRIFLAGASGVIGVCLIPLLVSDGHAVAGMARSPARSSVFAGSGLSRSYAMCSTRLT
jgi:NAD dependent epimerase/dehydratase family enzyme